MRLDKFTNTRALVVLALVLMLSIGIATAQRLDGSFVAQ